MRYKLVVVLMCLSFWAFGDDFNTVFGGVIENSLGRKVKLKYYDEFVSFQEVVHNLTIDEAGNFKLPLAITSPIITEFTVEGKFFSIYLEPRDTTWFQINALNLFMGLPSFEGRGAVHNQYLYDYNKAFPNTSDEKMRLNMRFEKPENFKKILDKETEKRWSFYQDYANRYLFSEEFTAFAEANITYWRAYQLMLYRWEHPADPGQYNPIWVSESYYSFLNEVKLNEEKAMNNPYYVYFITQYVSYIREKEHLPDYYSDYLIAQRVFTGKTLDYFKAKELYILCKRGKAQAEEDQILNFLENCPYPEYIRALRPAYDKAKTLFTYQIAPEFALYDTKNELVTLSQFKGKIVVLDFWATWCAPCLHEMSYSQKLLERFGEQNKDVVFVFVALDMDRQNWERYVKNHNLKGIHVFAEYASETPIINDYRITNIPFFTIIDRTGRFFKVPARKPSEGGTYEDIMDVMSRPYDKVEVERARQQAPKVEPPKNTLFNPYNPEQVELVSEMHSTAETSTVEKSIAPQEMVSVEKEVVSKAVEKELPQPVEVLPPAVEEPQQSQSGGLALGRVVTLIAACAQGSDEWKAKKPKIAQPTVRSLQNVLFFGRLELGKR